jgi:hypothetical protein
MTPPLRAAAPTPQGATPTDRQSRIRGVCLGTTRRLMANRT